MYIRINFHNYTPTRYEMHLSKDGGVRDIVHISYDDLVKLTSRKKIKDFLMKHCYIYSRSLDVEEQRLVDKQINKLLEKHMEEL